MKPLEMLFDDHGGTISKRYKLPIVLALSGLILLPYGFGNALYQERKNLPEIVRYDQLFSRIFYLKKSKSYEDYANSVIGINDEFAKENIIQRELTIKIQETEKEMHNLQKSPEFIYQDKKNRLNTLKRVLPLGESVILLISGCLYGLGVNLYNERKENLKSGEIKNGTI